MFLKEISLFLGATSIKIPWGGHTPIEHMDEPLLEA
jgi:hypothetical protein